MATNNKASAANKKGKRSAATVVVPTADDDAEESPSPSPPPQQLRSAKQRQTDEGDDSPPSKKKKSIVGDSPKGSATKRSPVKPAEKSVSAADKVGDDWSNDDIAHLIEKLMVILPKDDVVKYNTQIEKVNWDVVKFANHTAEDCKEKVLQITAMQRRFRTLVELMEEAREWVKHPWMGLKRSKKQGKHPDLPKKPLTPYFRYFLEKRSKYSQEHPDKSMTELAKLLAKKFAELPDKKKQKYKESYEKENETYKVLMQKFRKEHPDMYPEEHHGGRGAGKSAGRAVGPQKPQSSWQIFLADKMKKHPSSSKKDLEKYRQQWKVLAENKKIKWIKKAMADEQRYAAELEQFVIDNPDCKFSEFKSVINKADKEIKARCDGKPEKPPNSGYSLYSKIMLKELKDIPSKEKMSEISKRWRELSDVEKESYAKQVSEALEKYQKEYLHYLAGLPEDERKKLEDIPKKKRPIPVARGRAVGAAQPTDNKESSKPKKPLSALFFFQQEKHDYYKSKYPDRSEQELTRMTAREFLELSDKKKEKYKRMAEEAKKMEDLTKASKAGDMRNKTFKGEPKKPPQSGYLVYTTEMITKMHDVEPKQRMGEISKRWNVLPVVDRERYKKKAFDLTKKYNKDLEKFLAGLSEEDRIMYDQMKTDKKLARGGAQSKANLKKAKAASVKKESASEEENDSDKGESSGSGSGSESSSQDSEKSASESEKSESESGSSDDESESENTNKGATSQSTSESESEDSDGSESESGSD